MWSLFSQAKPDPAFPLAAAQRDTLVSVFGDERRSRTEWQEAQCEHVNESLSRWDTSEVNTLIARAQVSAFADSQLPAQESTSASEYGSDGSTTGTDLFTGGDNPTGESTALGGLGLGRGLGDSRGDRAGRCFVLRVLPRLLVLVRNMFCYDIRLRLFISFVCSFFLFKVIIRFCFSLVPCKRR